MIKVFMAGLLLVTMAAPLVRADNITAKARIPRDMREVNQGRAYDIFLPANARPEWRNMQPMTGRVSFRLYFPVAGDVTVKSIKAASRYESAKVMLLASKKGKLEKLGQKNKLNFNLKSPVEAKEFFFVLDDITNKDHDVLQYLNWRIEGKASGSLLFNPDDLKLTCNAEDNTVELNEPVKLRVQVNDRLKKVKSLRLMSDMISYQGKEVCHLRQEKIFSGNCDMQLEYKVNSQGPYFVTVYLYDGYSSLVAAKRIIVGVRDRKLFETGEVKEFKSGSPVPVMSVDDIIKHKGTIFSADATQSLTGRGKQPGEAYFKKIKAAGGEMLMSFLRYSDFEPLPGVYNFEYFDHMVKYAGRYGLGLEAGLWWWDFNGPTQYWLKDERIRQRDGSVGKGKKGVFSVHSRKFNRHAVMATELLIKRYKDCPEIWFWHPHPYGGVDHDGEGIYDFHPDTLKDWAAYLQKKYGSIKKLNKVYNSQYKDWKSVPVPAPLYEELDKKKDFAAMIQVVDTRPQWIDWLDFYHRGLLDFRVNMMKLVRKYDKKRGISGVNATGGVGKADLTFAKLKEYDAFYGDQGLNILHHVRRLVAKRRYGLRLRHEDIAPVTIGRRGLTEATAIDRSNWDAFQICVLGASHFNYVFTTWTNSPFWNLLFANPRAQKLVKESNRAKLVTRPVGYLHSFTTDRFAGKYNYQNIPIARWWVMNGFSEAMLYPGNFFEMFSDGCDLKELKKMKVVIDDGSTVLTEKAEDALVDYVKNGGKLVLFVSSGQRTFGKDGEYSLLHRLGYKDTASLLKRRLASAMLVFNRNNPVFGRTAAIPLNRIASLKVPDGGTVLGRVKTDVAAVLWSHGKGRIVLIGGIPGSVTEDQIQGLWSGKSREEKKKAGPLWAAAERELGGVAADITRDAAEWAGVALQFSLPDRFRACLKQDGDKFLVYMYNNGPAERGVLRIPGLKGQYKVTAETLEKTYDLGSYNAADIAIPGLALPELGKYRYMVVRLTK